MKTFRLIALPGLAQKLFDDGQHEFSLQRTTKIGRAVLRGDGISIPAGWCGAFEHALTIAPRLHVFTTPRIQFSSLHCQIQGEHQPVSGLHGCMQSAHRRTTAGRRKMVCDRLEHQRHFYQGATDRKGHPYGD